MLRFIKSKLASDRVSVRIGAAYPVFLLVFFSITIISYYFLPEGILRNKHPLQNWDTSRNLVKSTMQIFSYNMLSVVAILLGNTFTSRRNSGDDYFALGYTAFFVMISINAVVLGTWSFSVVSTAVPLADRILRTFDLVHRAGLWEMSGQLLILCATSKSALIITDGKKTTTRSWRRIRLSRQEAAAFAGGLGFMLIGAFVESLSIIKLVQ